MGHIEFIGQAGSGKSTLYSMLTKNDKYYSADKHDVLERVVLADHGDTYKRIYNIAPVALQSRFAKMVYQCTLREEAFENFILDRPQYLSIIDQIVSESDYKEDHSVRRMKYLAEEYQIGIKSADSSEIYCMDTAFAMLAASLLGRTEGQLSLDEYIEAIPTPDVLVHIETPVKTCLQRRRNRDGKIELGPQWGSTNPKKAHRKYQGYIQNVINSFQPHSEVVTIQNTGPIDKSAKELKYQLDRAVNNDEKFS